MDIGTYAAASGGVLQMRKLEVQNHNLANIDTVGFKGQYVVPIQQSFDQTLASTLDNDPFGAADHARVPNVADVGTAIDFSQGPIRNTGNPFDAALRNTNDFFVINSPQGPLYTRAGNFAISQNGELITQDGLQVQGDGGAILIQAPGARITQDGGIQIGANTVGRLQVVHFDDTTGLEAVSAARFRIAGGAQPVQVEPYVEPQTIEMSNVSAITGMIDLITTNRAFDAYSKAAQTIDSLNQISINQVGKRIS